MTSSLPVKSQHYIGWAHLLQIFFKLAKKLLKTLVKRPSELLHLSLDPMDAVNQIDLTRKSSSSNNPPSAMRMTDMIASLLGMYP